MNPSTGFNTGLAALPLLSNMRTRSVCAENPTGEKGKGGMAIPNPSAPAPPAAGRAADDLGQGWKVRPFLRVNKGKTSVLMDVAGPGIIQHIWMAGEINRAHVLRFYWDDEQDPSIEVPLTDFFALGHDLFAPVNSQAVIVNPRAGLNCYWPMPFRRRARVTVTNESDKRDLELLAYQITYAETDVPAEAGYFHAQWRRAMTDEVNPYVILDGVKGKGRYVGTFLAWTQMTPGWFGEGEIKFYMDGDNDFPTICGTGTEDHFGGSYGFQSIYSTAYVGTVLPGENRDPKLLDRFMADLAGDQRTEMQKVLTKDPPHFWSLYRWHIMDPICFDRDLRVTIQALGWGANGKYAKLKDDIASTAYWYQTEPHAAFPSLPSLEARLKRQQPKPAFKAEGAFEGEHLKIIAKSGGKTTGQVTGLSAGESWSGGAHLWWTDAKPGDTLDLAVPCRKEGKYRLKVRLTKSYDYGIVQLYWDGMKLGNPIDLFSAAAMPTEELDLGVHKLKKGEHTLRLEIVGANEKAVKAYMAGLDYVVLQEAP